MVKCLPAMLETQVRSLGQEEPLEKEMATHSSTLAWEIPWTEEPGSLKSMGLQRVRHDWATTLLYFKPISDSLLSLLPLHEKLFPQIHTVSSSTSNTFPETPFLTAFTPAVPFSLSQSIPLPCIQNLCGNWEWPCFLSTDRGGTVSKLVPLLLYPQCLDSTQYTTVSE